ncbi:DUF6-domain-containing protein [Suhomyces tanzawaensis NRRL Y-17324]|uniref:DUF6-domain-containing protein n=1 Tax=Suhomyces tanzawaensis NRRL Y-17324 TaxID=984487 RepID=A0A1E4SR93_9ASCO|nr:DUF6-domain-containing protein [Suhomyces tanzawaensis NRRL Y-17324]ODV82018.1 DUF6-domain-containing protein [Suhomyces tanzawaensis NRRL Y-17324]
MSESVLSEPWDDVPSGPIQKAHRKLTQLYQRYIDPNVGFSLLILSQFFNSIMVVTCKLLVTDKEFDTPIHPLQILFVRMSITYVCCLAYMVVTRSVPEAPFGPRNLRFLLLLRGLVGFVGVFGLYYSLQYLSLSDAVAITFLVPMVTAFLACVILHERYSVLEAVCSIVSLAGVLLIAKPHFLFGHESDSETSVGEEIESSSTEKRLLASAVGLVGVCGASSVYIILRKIGHGAHPLLSVSYFALTCTIVTFFSILVIPSLEFAIPKNGYQWFLFALIGLSGFFMQFSLTAGVQRVKASKASMAAYTNMVFALVWDLLIWRHIPGLLSLLGMMLILGNAAIIVKFKPEDNNNDGDLERGDQSTADEVKYGVVGSNVEELIALQDFLIADSEDELDPERVERPPGDDKAALSP